MNNCILSDVYELSAGEAMLEFKARVLHMFIYSLYTVPKCVFLLFDFKAIPDIKFCIF